MGAKSIFMLALVASIVVANRFAFGAWDDSSNNATAVKDSFLSSGDPSAVPFPGDAWLSRLSSTTQVITSDNKTYESAYMAILEGNPAAHPCRNLQAWVNSFVFGDATAAYLVQLSGNSIKGAHYIMCYLRNLLASLFVYYGTAGIFHYHIYIHPRNKDIFQHRQRPTYAVMWDQIKLAQSSIFLYDMLPLFADYLHDEGYSQVYYSLDYFSSGNSNYNSNLWMNFLLYAINMVCFFSLVEIGIYWVHRTLHTNKFLYKHVHLLHHKYNKPETLTPWASIAFHPLDGILQASPYVVVSILMPVHYYSLLLLLVFTPIWATYIHDSMDWNVDPIMGSKYHTVHHTHYIYNYGQVFTFCDRYWGTLRVPQNKTGIGAQCLKKSD